MKQVLISLRNFFSPKLGKGKRGRYYIDRVKISIPACYSIPAAHPGSGIVAIFERKTRKIGSMYRLLKLRQLYLYQFSCFFHPKTYKAI
jgi:hypothetical protein